MHIEWKNQARGEIAEVRGSRRDVRRVLLNTCVLASAEQVPLLAPSAHPVTTAAKMQALPPLAIVVSSALRSLPPRSNASRPSTALERRTRPRRFARSDTSATSRACARLPSARRGRTCRAPARSRATRAPRAASAQRRRRLCCARLVPSARRDRLRPRHALRASVAPLDRARS